MPHARPAVLVAGLGATSCRDQRSDLTGGYADHAVTLPNPTCSLP